MGWVDVCILYSRYCYIIAIAKWSKGSPYLFIHLKCLVSIHTQSNTTCVMHQFETCPALKLSDGFEAAQTVLKPTVELNADCFEGVQSHPCSLLDCFKAIYVYFGGTNRDHLKSVCPSEPDCLFKAVLAHCHTASIAPWLLSPCFDGVLAHHHKTQK